ncbi:SidA/IucD/PvdA family monooxygenase [Pedobacter sp. KACC 23697]|uniref:SidA/IucD/PvdA family monooxygenase n=1 Tax=Pedobacter sp. KACC 23697 TaxID=3149230 RepID=A0AAU7K3Y1_9SPHI
MKAPVYDVLVIGFGPAALGLAAAVEDKTRDGELDLSVKFIEKASSFSWHSNFLLPGTTINHHYFRDLATPRDPSSKFTFIKYLKEKGRLFEFGHFSGYPTRVEWNDYLSWAANKLDSYVQYDTEAYHVEWNNAFNLLEISTSKGTFLARHLVLATGLKMRIHQRYYPLLSKTLFHSSKFIEMLKANNFSPASEKKVLVVGSGQSAAEAVLYLRNRFSNWDIDSLHSAVGFKIKESGHLSNIIYHPEETDYFYGLEAHKKAIVLQDMTTADYGNVNNATSEQLFNRIYEDKVLGINKIKMIDRSTVHAIEQEGEQYQVTIREIYKDHFTIENYDLIVLCTGYYEEKYPVILKEISHHLLNDNEEMLCLNRNYKVEHKSEHDLNIYIYGGSERTHGISDTQSFTLMAIKANWILDEICAKFSKDKMIQLVSANGTVE